MLIALTSRILSELHTPAYFQLLIFTPDSCQTLPVSIICCLRSACWKFWRKSNPRKIMAHHANSSAKVLHREIPSPCLTARGLAVPSWKGGEWGRSLPTLQHAGTEAFKSPPTLTNVEEDRMLPQTPDRNSSHSTRSTTADAAREKICQETMVSTVRNN